jgi:hypothetical protein
MNTIGISKNPNNEDREVQNILQFKEEHEEG